MSGYPIELNLEGRPVLVVGLGQVGRRKVAGLREVGAWVVVVDPRGAGSDVPVGVEVRAEPYEARHLDGVALAFAAATPEVNRRVVNDAQRLGVWVNTASEPDQGDFRVPALWRDGAICLTVTTSGASPALARVLRDRAAEALGPAAVGLVDLLAEWRPKVLETVANPAARRRLLTGGADPALLRLWQAEGPEAVRRVLLARLDDVARSPRDLSSEDHDTDE